MLAKQLWADTLRAYSPEIIVRGCRAAIRDSKFLANLYELNRCCREQLRTLGLPDAHDAYREACFANSPKHNAVWSHPAVYFAGKACDWFRISSEPEARMLPIFERHYSLLCEQVMAGTVLEVPQQAMLEENISGPELDRDDKHDRMQAMRDGLDI